MPVFWKFGGVWVNVVHVIAVREMRARGEGPSKYKIILDGTLGELPGEIICEGEEARELLRLLEGCRGGALEALEEQATDFNLASMARR